MYIKNAIKYKLVKSFTACVDKLYECVAVEIKVGGKAFLVCCVYRTPGGDITEFNNHFEELNKHTSKRKKSMFILGDFNINLLNTDSHKGSLEFAELMYGNGLVPLIQKPTRITEYSATLIDNIFTNVCEEGLESGIIVTDISDHLPVFACCPSQDEKRNKPLYKYCQNVTDEGLVTMNQYLLSCDWTQVLNSESVNKAYQLFLEKFKEIYNLCCPVKKVNINKKCIDKPWFTHGLKNACKKKDCLYKSYLQTKSKTLLQKYKRYKNKLVSILRNEEKKYYSTIVKNSHSDMKQTWKVLKKVIKKNKSAMAFPCKFKCNNQIITSKKEICKKKMGLIDSSRMLDQI